MPSPFQLIFKRLFLTGAVIYASFSPALPIPATHPEPLRVFIDVGHGGHDGGAKGLYGIKESELTLDIGKMVEANLVLNARRFNRTIETRLSRDRDVYLRLRDRVRAANTWGADVFVSIHANSFPTPLAHGFEVYFLSPDASDEAARNLARRENENETETSVDSAVMSILSDSQNANHVKESSQLAETLFQALSTRAKANVRGVRQAPFTVLSGTEMPAVLIEVGYVNHPKDAVNLAKQSYLKQFANAISTGIIQFLSQTNSSGKVSELNHDYTIRRPKS